jgi:L-alanine-DL-glutamate epimerase-like enolase superfamily enzyme
MEITDVSVEVVRARRVFGQSSAVKTAEESVFVWLRVSADDGSVGIGEISDVERPASMPGADAIEAEIGEFLIGEDPRDLNRLTDQMYAEIDFGPFRFHSFQQLALAAVDTALYDLVATRYDVPVYRFLGGDGGEVPLCWVVFTRQDPDAAAALRAEVRTRVEEGFTAFKLKVGEAPRPVDRERIRIVREVAGDDADIFLDAQGVWGPDDAVRAIERFEPLGIDGVETPVGHRGDAATAGYYYDTPLVPSELAAVREAVDTPIFEHVLDPAFGIELAAADAVDAFTVEVCGGGLARARRVLSIAAAAGVDARLGSTVELGPGTAAAAAAAADPAVSRPSDLIGPLVYDNVDVPGVTYQAGSLRPSPEPGFGPRPDGPDG